MNENEAINAILNYLNKSIEDHKIYNIDLENKKHHIQIDNLIFHVKELTWKEFLNIELKSYVSIDGNIFYDKNIEKKLVFDLSVLSVNGDIFIFENISPDTIEILWEKYQQYLHLSLEEIDFLYKSSKNYFSDKNIENYPLHPLILEVDYMTKGIVHYSKSEFENLSTREFEAIQLILSTKNEI